VIKVLFKPALKHKYRMKLLTKFIDAIDNEMQFRTTVLDAITLLKQAWNEVSSTTIANCFRHSGFVHSTSSEADQEVDDDMELEAEECEQVVDRLNTLLHRYDMSTLRKLRGVLWFMRNFIQY
jgi:hypothetical protein